MKNYLLFGLLLLFLVGCSADLPPAPEESFEDLPPEPIAPAMPPDFPAEGSELPPLPEMEAVY